MWKSQDYSYFLLLWIKENCIKKILLGEYRIVIYMHICKYICKTVKTIRTSKALYYTSLCNLAHLTALTSRLINWLNPKLFSFKYFMAVDLPQSNWLMGLDKIKQLWNNFKLGLLMNQNILMTDTNKSISNFSVLRLSLLWI